MITGKRRLTDLRFWVLLASTALVIFGGKAWPGSSASTLQAKMPGPDAQQLWKYISKDNPYKSWKNFPDLSERFLHVKENPHGDWIATYLNNQAYQSVVTPSSPFKMEYGSIIVKENYILSKGAPSPQPPFTSVPVMLSSLTVMYKIKGYRQAPGQEEWFWVMFSCNGNAMAPSQWSPTNLGSMSKSPYRKTPLPSTKERSS